MASAEEERKAAGGSGTLSLLGRPLDLLFVLWFIVYFFTVMISDYHNFTAARMGLPIPPPPPGPPFSFLFPSPLVPLTVCFSPPALHELRHQHL